ncbi:polysaccharide pyruvyl transferase family protein [Noviherbaspirillum saxi]|uniref:Polysaccharide pyruvyl transferase family protein n=1 Tax=Noviherbaspirillum saxi TaxID=2320863 RepID=A0A3A3FNE3_9BURK|nr:polysaccharide pyruvyl transferase family protein [Noviherbaspirillum saxi]RJF95189.1 polysaccharide pyruvyl transferase family protein [Noviherbaspirillum saxi]
MQSHPPVILFGAMDRHNFGDLLFPHVLGELLQEPKSCCAGLVERDLRNEGGHHVRRLTEAIAAQHGSPFYLIHVGGEVLTCGVWEAAVMLLPDAEATAAIRQFAVDRLARPAWAQGFFGIGALAPYTVARAACPGAASVIYHAVGGVDLAISDVAQRDEVIAKLMQADVVSVRDAVTFNYLAGLGMQVRLIPDPAVMVAELFHSRIADRALQGEVAQLDSIFPDGYIAMQFSADYGDDTTLATMASQIDELARATGYGVALFRAGTAPWHDDLDTYRRLAARVVMASVTIVSATGLWDICALIANSRLYAGSSLHGRIVAMAYGVPRVNLRHPAHARMTKQASYAATWDIADMPVAEEASRLAAAAHQALRIDRSILHARAAWLVHEYRKGFAHDFKDSCR